jgi:hypothetical protein
MFCWVRVWRNRFRAAQVAPELRLFKSADPFIRTAVNPGGPGQISRRRMAFIIF